MPIITLHDDDTGSQAEILPELGFNCFRFATVHDDQPLEVLWAEEDFESGSKRASGSGIPVLFPFPGRIAGTSFVDDDGAEYPLEAGDGRGNAIHGFVLNRRWRVVEHSARHVTGEFQASVDAPAILKRWPADFQVYLTWRIDGNSLSMVVEVDNPANRPLPFGFGLHPYFRVPLGGSDAAACRLTLPADEYWQKQEMLPTGKRLPSADLGPIAAGMTLADVQLDDVLTGLKFDQQGRCAGRIEDPQSGRRVTVSFGEAFDHCVVYTPPHRQAICMEPYTCAPDAARLEAQGVEAGWRRLEPGGRFRAQVVIGVE